MVPLASKRRSTISKAPSLRTLNTVLERVPYAGVLINAGESAFSQSLLTQVLGNS